MNGIDLIDAERMRQVNEEGWTPEHDDGHRNGELEDAARCYFATATIPGFVLTVLGGTSDPSWPWHWKWYKPFDAQHRGYFPKVDVLRCLVKAGALARAEEERLERQHGMPVDKNRVRRLVLGIAAEIDRLTVTEYLSHGTV